MTPRERNRFYSFWTLALLLCFALSVFVLFFASCSKEDLSRDAQENGASGEPVAAAIVWESDRL